MSFLINAEVKELTFVLTKVNGEVVYELLETS